MGEMADLPGMVREPRGGQRRHSAAHAGAFCDHSTRIWHLLKRLVFRAPFVAIPVAVAVAVGAAGCSRSAPDAAIAAALPPFPIAAPEEVGLSSAALERATAVLQAHIDEGDIPGVVAAVVRDGKLVYFEALGVLDVESGDPMPDDALFRIYSMTRPVTALGILLLHEEGLLDVDDPLQRYLPEFREQPVLRDPSIPDPTAVRPRVGDVTIAQLLTHTSGIGSRSSELYRAHDVHRYDLSLEEVARRVAALPLFEDPGTHYRYGMHAELLGRVIEVVSRRSAEDFLHARIFEPLGMEDAVFHVGPERAGRLATVHRRDANDRLRAHEMEAVPVTERRALTSTGVGLVTSTMDLLRFAQLFLDEGRVGERQLIRPETVRMATENAVPEALRPLGPRGYWAASGWSLGGFAVALDPDRYDHAVSQGEFWWDGSAGTRFWIDPEKRMITIVMAQISPAGGNGFREAFKAAVAGASP